MRKGLLIWIRVDTHNYTHCACAIMSTLIYSRIKTHSALLNASMCWEMYFCNHSELGSFYLFIFACCGFGEQFSLVFENDKLLLLFTCLWHTDSFPKWMPFFLACAVDNMFYEETSTSKKVKKALQHRKWLQKRISQTKICTYNCEISLYNQQVPIAQLVLG